MEAVMVNRLVVLLSVPWLILGCAAPSHNLSDSSEPVAGAGEDSAVVEAQEASATTPETVPVPAAALEEGPAVRPEDAGTRRQLEKMTIRQVRARYPQYNDMDDMELARGIHGRYFRDVPFADFTRKFLGYQP
jgi:hypothetical protein